ncbi:hypothetical protein DFH09DRAFT_1422556 [Mycena vulgaris]|nr:hypothetical protein DFH09DRAFT_1422556 [Mycena vulgaris]
MSPAHLAKELLEAIVGEVQSKDTLKACSLVSRSLTVCSQRRLFHALCLVTNPNAIKSISPTHRPTFSLDSARNLFSMAPHLTQYVTDLALCLTRPTVFAPFRLIIWDEMPGLTSSLHDIFVGPHLRSLSLAHIRGVPLSLILHAMTSLESIAITTISIREDITSAPPTFISKPHPPSEYNPNLKDVVISARVEFQENGRYQSILDFDIHSDVSEGFGSCNWTHQGKGL